MDRWLLQVKLGANVKDAVARRDAIRALRAMVAEYEFSPVRGTTMQLAEGDFDLVTVIEGAAGDITRLKRDARLPDIGLSTIRIADDRPLADAFGQWRGGQWRGGEAPRA